MSHVRKFATSSCDVAFLMMSTWPGFRSGAACAALEIVLAYAAMSFSGATETFKPSPRMMTFWMQFASATPCGLPNNFVTLVASAVLCATFLKMSKMQLIAGSAKIASSTALSARG